MQVKRNVFFFEKRGGRDFWRSITNIIAFRAGEIPAPPETDFQRTQVRSEESKVLDLVNQTGKILGRAQSSCRGAPKSVMIPVQPQGNSKQEEPRAPSPMALDVAPTHMMRSHQSSNDLASTIKPETDIHQRTTDRAPSRDIEQTAHGRSYAAQKDGAARTMQGWSASTYDRHGL